jgi:hypothetical protein
VALLVVVFVALRLAGVPGPSPSSSRSRPPAHARSATTSPPSTLPTPPQSTRPSPSSTVSTTTSSTPSTTTTSSTVSTTTTTPAPGSFPQLSSVSPSAAGAGTVVVVHGTNFFSRNGLVLARFGAQPARTYCPSQTTCMVTVPTLPGSTSTVPLTISTESGTSNALSFRYA